jgi:DNA repair protein RAD5
VLRREDFDQYRFDGSMDVKKRTEAISGFKSPSKEAKVMIISLKAGGVGLNVSSYCRFGMTDTHPSVS